MVTIVTILHIIACMFLIGVVLLQQGKGADVGAAFGSGSANSVFGSRGPASFLFKLTPLCALLMDLLPLKSKPRPVPTIVEAIEPLRRMPVIKVIKAGTMPARHAM